MWRKKSHISVSYTHLQVGMTKASKTPAEFNVTNYLKEGENLLAVQIYRWHDGS